MLTTFAYKEIESRNRNATDLALVWTAPSRVVFRQLPDVLKIGEAIRRGDLDGYQIDGETVSEGSRVSLSS
jgi:hypothetical protein